MATAALLEARDWFVQATAEAADVAPALSAALEAARVSGDAQAIADARIDVGIMTGCSSAIAHGSDLLELLT